MYARYRGGKIAADMDGISRSLMLWMLLFSPMCILFLYLNIANPNLDKIQAVHRPAKLIVTESAEKKVSEGAYDTEHAKFLIRRFVKGAARTKLNKNGISCVSEPTSTFCVTTDAIRLVTGPTLASTIYLAAGQRLPKGDKFSFKPYPRTDDGEAMRMTAPVKLIAEEPGLPPCDEIHSVPAVVFSTGGLAGNFYHDVSDVIIPLFLTAGLFQSHVQLVVTDYETYWEERYRRFLSDITSHKLVVVTSRYWDVSGGVHCFPAAIIGVKSHGHLMCNASREPGGVDSLDFKRFFHATFSLKVARLTPSTGQPRLLLLSQWKSRVILNQENVIRLAEEIGFRVEQAWPDLMTNKEEASELVNSCSVLMGVHDPSLANMVFLPSDAVVLQIVLFGLDRRAEEHFGRQTTGRFGLGYVKYKTVVEESSLHSKYPHNHPVIADPFMIYQLGYNTSEKFYMEEQNITINVHRFRRALVQAMALLPRP